MTGAHITIVRPDDETMEVQLYGDTVVCATHENVGWEGMAMVEAAVRAVAAAGGLDVHEARE